MISLFEEVAIKKANHLLDLLNEGKKGTDIYKSQYYFPHNGYLVFMAANAKKDLLFNIIDKDGNIPEGFSVCWRSLPHIKQEIGL